MKILIVLFCFISISSLAQDAPTMEKKAKELYRIIGLDDKDQWLKFVKENYTPAFIARPVTGRVSANGQEINLSEETKASTDAEAKANLLARLHNDFGKSKIISINPEQDKLKMVLRNENGLTGTFDLTFDKNNMIDRFGVQAEMK